MRGPLVFLGVLGAPILHAPLLARDLLPSLKRPLDFGATIGGKRIFGDNKTVRGALAMFTGALAATLGLSRVPVYWDALPEPVREAGPWRLGSALGFGVVAGELPNSAIKRRIGVAPGEQAPPSVRIPLRIFDQADFVPAIWLAMRPFYRMPAAQAALSFALVALIHLPINLIGYAIGARSSRW